MAKLEPKWQRRPEQRPNQIIRAALDTFAEKGFRAATMDEIARAAGITKGTIYLYFASKEALFVAVVRAQIERAMALLPDMVVAQGEDLRTQSRRLGGKVIEVLMSPEVSKVLPLFIAEFRHLPGLRRLYQEEMLGGINLRLASLLEQGMALGLIRRMDPVIAARCLAGMFVVFVLSQEVFGAKEVTPMDHQAIVDTVFSIYFDGVLRRGAMS